ncbi:MAG: sigma-54-dependent Fis family transcriptional regulator, partial [Planctomycetota bacterium]
KWTLADQKELEKKILLAHLKKSNWRIYGEKGAAKRLSIPPTTLASKIKRLGLKRTL